MILISFNGRQLGFAILLVLVNPFGAKLFSLLRTFPSETDAADLVSFCPQRVVESTGWVCFAIVRLYSLIYFWSLDVLLTLEYSSSTSDVTVKRSGMVNATGETDLDESLARKTDLCLTCDCSLSSLS